jgi:phosphoglycerate dehydrogenase-like enzyme
MLGMNYVRISIKCLLALSFFSYSRQTWADEQALPDMLETGRRAGAALDVFDGEFAPDFEPGPHPLIRYASAHDNLLLIPHIGGSTYPAWRETERRVINMATDYFRSVSE